MIAIEKPKDYVNYITFISCLIYGLKILDGQSISFFSDVLMESMSFSASEYTSLTSLYYLSYGISSVALGLLISQSRKRKSWLLLLTSGVGASSLLASFADSYLTLAACRCLSGFFSGCSLSVILGIVAKNLTSNDYGARNGIINAVSSLIGSVFGPLYFAFMANRYSWNTAFLVLGIAFLLATLVVLLTVREVEYRIIPRVKNEHGVWNSISTLFSSRIFVLCLVLGIIETAANLSLGVFMPLYFTDAIGMDAITKGFFLSFKGLAYIPICFIVPILCDYFSMKSVLIFSFILAFISPMSAFLASGTLLSAYILVAFGSVAEVTVTIYVYMIPRRFLPEQLHSAANGILLGSAVIIGGCIAPVALSSMIDRGTSVTSIMGICAFLFFACILLSAAMPLTAQNK